jgi:hypothetical protein
MVKSLRRVQRRGARGADAQNENEKMNRPNAKQLHPVNNLSTLGYLAARSPSDAALGTSNPYFQPLTSCRALHWPVAPFLSTSRECEIRNSATKTKMQQQAPLIANLIAKSAANRVLAAGKIAPETVVSLDWH